MRPARSLLPLSTAVALGTLGAAAAEVRLHGHTFTLPEGFTLERAVSPDLVPRPIAGSFDPQGRLYVTDSAGVNLPPSEQLKDPRNRILRLEDVDGDGVFDRSTVYAERVMFPQGCLWHDGSVYVAGPPSIWKFTDTDGDGVADRREEWYQGRVLTGCANDVHGPYLGPEGMLYWTKGAFARLDLQAHDGTPIRDRCAHLFRARPDGSGMEVVASGGMDNPVEVAFTGEGEPILISTFIDLSQPGRRDGLAHAVHGGVFGKAQDAVEEPEVRRTGPLLPVLSQFGPAAACAILRYEGGALGPEYRDNLFGTLFNLRKVTRHVLRPAGSSYASEDSDFLVSDQIDFRPTDLVQDADGSLLVVDTGGWYKLCCPSSQLAKSDVLGAIYRVRRTGTPSERPLPAAGRAAGYQRLARTPEWTGASPVVEAKRMALSARLADAPRLRELLAANLPRAAASSEAARLVRLAAEGLGRMRDRQSVPSLLQAAGLVGDSDRFLEHSLIYALIEIGDGAAVRAGLAGAGPEVTRVALRVLEQVAGSGLKPAEVLPHLHHASAALRETALWVARRHPAWAAELGDDLQARLGRPGLSKEEQARSEGLLPLLANGAAGQAALGAMVVDERFSPTTRRAALDAMAGAGVKEVPAAWRDAVVRALGDGSPAGAGDGVLSSALRAAQALPWGKSGDPRVVEALRGVARSPAAATSMRLEALAALPAGSVLGDREFGVLVAVLGSADASGRDRLVAATALGRVGATPAQLADVAGILGQTGPMELPRLIPVFGVGGTEALGARIVDGLAASKGLRSLRPGELRQHMARFPGDAADKAEALLTRLQSDAAQDRVRLEQWLAKIESLPGDIRRGQTLFNSTKAACSTCHRLGYLGGDLGPDLTSIGTVRTARDLLEAVLFPSASFVRSYEPWVLVTRDGEEYSGVLRRDTPEEVVLATGPGAEVRVGRADVQELRAGTLSTMPAGLDEQLQPQELADLLAFLKNTRWGVN